MYGKLNTIIRGHIKAFNLTKFILEHKEIDLFQNQVSQPRLPYHSKVARTPK